MLKKLQRRFKKCLMMKNKYLVSIIIVLVLTIIGVYFYQNKNYSKYHDYENKLYLSAQNYIKKHNIYDSIIVQIDELEIDGDVKRCSKSYVEIKNKNNKTSYKICLICNDYNPYGNKCVNY